MKPTQVDEPRSPAGVAACTVTARRPTVLLARLLMQAPCLVI